MAELKGRKESMALRKASAVDKRTSHWDPFTNLLIVAVETPDIFDKCRCRRPVASKNALSSQVMFFMKLLFHEWNILAI